MSHNVFSEAMFDNNVIEFLTKHDYNWTANKHFGGKCKAFPCSCCRAHPKPGSTRYAPQQQQPADEWACKLCLGAWTLSTVSRDARDKVLSNAGQQMYWYNGESKGIGKGYEPQQPPVQRDESQSPPPLAHHAEGRVGGEGGCGSGGWR